MERGDLWVKQQVARINGKVTEAPLKIKNAYRTLPFSEDTVSVLLEQKKKRAAAPGAPRRLAAGQFHRAASCTYSMISWINS